MSTAKREKLEKPASDAPYKVDWAKIDALTDEEIERQIAEDPDAAPDISEWSLDDPAVVVIEPIDARAIRAKLGMSQEEFARVFGLRVATVRDWEQQRRVPRGPSLTLLRIIDREPEAAQRAVAPPKRVPAEQGAE